MVKTAVKKSKKRNGNKKGKTIPKNNNKKFFDGFFLKSLISFLLVSIILLSGIGFYILHTALSPTKSSRNIDETYIYMYSEYPFLKKWVRSLKKGNELKDLEIYAKEDSTVLHALYIKSPIPTKNTAVIIHGHKNNAVNMLHIAYMYNHDLKFNVLLPDLRGHGKSGGDHIQMGWNDRRDVMQWMDVANNLFGGDTKMVVHGISMGAATAMMVSGEKQPSYVKAYVEDCGYTSVWDEFAYVAEKDYHIPKMPFLYVADFMCKWKNGWSFKEASSVEQLKKSDKPMLFIHGGADTYVPTDMVYTLYQSKPKDKHIWTVSGVMHAMSYHDRRNEYTERVKAFLNMYLYNTK